MLGLHLAELERRRHQTARGLSPALGRPDGGDYGVDHVEGLQEPFDDVRPGLRPAQAVLGPAGYDLDLVGDVGFQRRLQVERPRPAVDQRHHVDAETGLERRQFVQVVEYDVGVGVPLERDDDLRVVAGREVLYVADAFELAAVDQLGNAFLDSARAGLVRQLGDDDLGTATRFFDRRLGPHADRTATGPVGVDNPLAAEDEAHRWESPAL